MPQPRDLSLSHLDPMTNPDYSQRKETMVSIRSWFVLAALLPGTPYAAVEVKRQDQAGSTSDESVSTSTFSLSSAPPTTEVITSVVTQSATNPTESNTPVTIVVTRVNSASESPITTTFTATGRLTTFTTTRPATVITITGQTLVDYTSVITSTPGSDPTSSQAALNTGGSSGSSEGGGGGGLSGGAKAGIGVGVAVGVIAVAAAVLIYIRHRRRRKSPLATEPGLEKDGVPVSELHDKSKPHEAGSTALHELQVEPSELEDSNKDKMRRPSAELEGDEPRPK